MEQSEWELLTPEEKKRELYNQQKLTLDLFLEHGAITQIQYDISLRELNSNQHIEK